jgi:hypothetical protein
LNKEEQEISDKMTHRAIGNILAGLLGLVILVWSAWGVANLLINGVWSTIWYCFTHIFFTFVGMLTMYNAVKSGDY